MSAEPAGLTHARLRAPRVAVAGILFSVLLLAVVWLMRRSVAADFWVLMVSVSIWLEQNIGAGT
jgi:hypothetical protein